MFFGKHKVILNKFKLQSYEEKHGNYRQMDTYRSWINSYCCWHLFQILVG